MLNTRSLRSQLAMWYFASVAALCALAATGYWYDIRTALNSALDQELRYRLIGLREFLDEAAPGGEQAIATRLNVLSSLSELYQVFDANGVLIAQSRGLAHRAAPQQPPQSLGLAIRYTPGGIPGFPMRLAWQKVSIGSQVLVLGVADPQRKFAGVLRAFSNVLLISMPIILAMAAAGGLWISRRALAPVARITKDARLITEANLSARLSVPATRDEVQWLSETLNSMLERLDQSFTRTRQFTADASHELRAPITLISTAAQYSLRRERSREELTNAMQKILRESQRTTALIDDLLLLARGDSGREVAQLRAIDAVPIVRETAERGAAMPAARGIAVSLELHAETLVVQADGTQLARLLLILLDNAVKYTPAGGHITIAGNLEDSAVAISIADTGSGIAPEDLPHVFERFWRADKVRSRDSGGTGLGLSIAQQIAQRHNAQLEARSVIGKGSIFTVRLPRPS